MLGGLVGGRPLGRVDVEQELDELFRLLRRLYGQERALNSASVQKGRVEVIAVGRTLPIPLVELYPASDRLIHQFVGVVAPEGRVATQQNVGDDAVKRRANVSLSRVNARR